MPVVDTFRCRSEAGAPMLLIHGGAWDIPDEECEAHRLGLKKALEDSSFQVKPLDLINNPKVPEDAAVVAVIGPTVALLEPEMDLLRDYARSGGRMLVAADPGQ